MKSLVIFALAIAQCYGLVEWKDFRAGNVKLPTSESKALAAGWKALDLKDEHKMTWYSPPDDLILLGYDGAGKLAGVRAVFLKSATDPAYTSDYEKSGIYEAGTILGQQVYYSTVLFSPEGVLKSGGRRSLPEDELALCVNLKRNGKFKTIPRDGCEVSQSAVVEQGCQSGYGLVFTKFGSKSSCDTLAPVYVIFDPQGTGNLIGFGWLSFSKFSAGDYKTTTFYKTLSGNEFKELFPKAPSCMSSYASQNGLTTLTVWLTYSTSEKTSCSRDNWTNSHCQIKRSTRPGALSDNFVDSEET